MYVCMFVSMYVCVCVEYNTALPFDCFALCYHLSLIFDGVITKTYSYALGGLW